MTKHAAAILSTALLITVIMFFFATEEETRPPVTTPLADFKAPFVFGRFEVPADNPLTEESVELGRFLFYDPRLSANNLLSCANCHRQELAFTDGMPGSVGISGKPLEFNAMSLVNLLWGPPRLFWDGRTLSLEEQALLPIEHPDEMGQSIPSVIEELKDIPLYQNLFARAYGSITAENLAKALSSFQRTLVSDNSRYDQYLRGEIKLTDQEELGRKLFMAHPDAKASLRGGNCIDCHSQFLTSGFAEGFDGFSNNGLDAEKDLKPGLMATTGMPEHKGLFKVPTLRNIALTAPYMHDGRLNTLEAVLDHYNEGIKPSSTLSPLIVEADNNELVMVDGRIVNESPSLNLNEEEKQAIIAFLHTLTDESFVSNPQFSDPFLELQHLTK